MCSLCAVLGASRNWTDAAGHDGFRAHSGRVTVRMEREHRVAILNRLLNTRGIAVSDWGGNSFIVEDRTGRRHNVYNLAGIWTHVHDMLGEAMDPLAPALLAAIESRKIEPP